MLFRPFLWIVGYTDDPPPIFFPVLGGCEWTDTFGVARDGGGRKHEGQDLMAAKLTPVVACFDGTVTLTRNHPNAGNEITLKHPNGWAAYYLHLNCDTPGTRDGKGGDEYAFAPGIGDGVAVAAGQFLGWVGDSGNARQAGPHLHFELKGPTGTINPASALRAARTIQEPLYPLPMPDLLPRRGEIRLDSMVRGESPLTVSPIAWVGPSGQAQIPTKPVRLSLAWEKDAAAHRADSPNEKVPLDRLRPGDVVYLLGSLERGGAGFTADRAVVAAHPVAVHSGATASPPPFIRPPLPPVVIKKPDGKPTPLPTPKPTPTPRAAPSPKKPAVAPTVPSVPSAPPPRDGAERVARLIEAINAYRKKNRLRPLTLNPHLNRAAQAHCEAMAHEDFFGHKDKAGRIAGQRVEAAGYVAAQLGECIAGGMDTPEEVVKFWAERSGGDRRLLLDPQFAEIGAGYAAPPPRRKSRYRHYWTVLVACPPPSLVRVYGRGRA